MREILFRGKRLDNGEWVNGCLAAYDLICPNYPEDTSNATGDYYGQTPYVGFAEVDPSTVGQFTGLTDKNGKRIFEGDIIRMNKNENDISVVEFGKFGCVCTEDESITDFVHGWYYRPLPTDALSRCEPFCWPFQLNEMCIKYVGIEVIGNIHDNPELLDGGADNG